jgi:hypothetical protein
MMRTNVQSPTLSSAIQSLYALAELEMPSARARITPLGELVTSHNLTCTELPGLTSQMATNYLLQRGGLVDAPDGAGQELLAGFLYANSRYGSIFVEQANPISRRRFSVAHELGHYLLHFLPSLITIGTDGQPALYEVMDAFVQPGEDVEPTDLPTGSMSFIDLSPDITFPATFEQMEQEANVFAAELLMPTVTVQELVLEYQSFFQGEDLVMRLSTEMLVSRAAMRWRLRSLGYM